MKWDSLWISSNIATCKKDANDYGLIDGAIAVKDGRIAWLGPLSELSAAPEKLATQIFNFKNHCITPGLIDCHTHLVYAGDRAQEFAKRLHGATYQEIAQAGGGILSTVKATRTANFDELYQQSANRLQTMINEGLTTIEIKSGYGLDLATEIKQLQVIKKLTENFPITVCPTFLGAHALPPEYQNKPDEYIDYLCEKVIPEIAKQNLATAIDAFCETIGFTPTQVERIFNAAHKYGLAIKLHAEQLSDYKGAILAAKYKALSADHLEYLSEDGVQALAKSNTVAVLLPTAFYFLREKKLPPIAQLRQHGVPIALSTDFNPGTSPTTSLLLVMNMACVLWQLTPEEALRGVTIHAAQALGLAADIGSLEVGKMADFVVWSYNSPEELSYYFGTNPPKLLIKKGKLLLKQF